MIKNDDPKRSAEICSESMSAMFSKGMEIFDDAIIGLTKDFKISVWSKGAEKKFGYHKSEIIGKNAKILVPEDRLKEIEEEVQTVMAGNIVEGYENVIFHKNGNPIDVSISVAPIYGSNGTVNEVVAIYKDVSEKKALVKKLNDYEKKCKLALEGGQFGVWELNIKNRKLFHLNNWKKNLGYEENDLDDALDTWLSLIHPDDIPEVYNTYNKHCKYREEYVVEYRIKCKNNSYKWIRSKGRIIEWDEDGESLRMIGTHEDISKERLIQEELKERYEQLELLKQEAESANKAKSQFLANMSHEIRTPMNGVIATLQLLQSSNLTDEQRKYVDLLKNSADNLIAIIDSILDIAKLESGKIELNNEPFNLRETINNLYQTHLLSANAKGLEAGCLFDPNIDDEVIGDELRLRQILTNLLSNAVKFTDKGYISFRARLISSDDNWQKIEFSVKDTGIGIDESYKPKIFENFSQGDLSKKKKYMGAGLGLAISKQLAELMNGDIRFESEVGKGSTFYFTCTLKKKGDPREPVNEKNIPDKKETHNQPANEKVILCIEDNLINQEIMESIINKRGYKYLAAYDGNEALEKLKEHEVDLILMDIQMPGLNGYEVTNIIRNMEDNGRYIPIIAMTAYAMHEDRDKCIQAGMNEYISKPIDIDKLYNILNTILEK
ncbi:MAG TPA: PAS domain-containing protein [Clostridiaceae bacterium]|nr:PAS domain-containing protein [Clostridiaceae bacterium]